MIQKQMGDQEKKYNEKLYELHLLQSNQNNDWFGR